MARTSKQKNQEGANPEPENPENAPDTGAKKHNAEVSAAKETAAKGHTKKAMHEEADAGKGSHIEDNSADDCGKYEGLSDTCENTGAIQQDTQPQDDEIAQQDCLAIERDRYLRLAAEYDNFRKRSTKELKTTYSDARADAITKLLPVYDNLERALKMDCSDEQFYKGVEMTMTQLTEILENMGVVQINAIGEVFDPNRHNAVATVEDPNLGEKIVAEEYQKGFMLGERVIRFSTVVVAN